MQLPVPAPSTFRLPPVTGSAVQQIRTGSNRTARSSDRDCSHSQQAEAEGKRQDPFFPPHSIYFEERWWQVPEELHRKDLNGGAWPGLAPSSCHVHGSAPGYSHPTAAVFPATLRTMLKNPDWHLLYFALRKEKKRCNSIPLQYNTSNLIFLYSTRKVQIGNRYVHRKNKHLKVPIKGRN